MNSTTIGVTFALVSFSIFTAQVVGHAVNIRRRRLVNEINRAFGHANSIFSGKVKR